MSILSEIWMVVWIPLIIGSVSFFLSLVFAYIWFELEQGWSFFVVIGLCFITGIAFYFMDWGTLHTVVSVWIGQVVG